MSNAYHVTVKISGREINFSVNAESANAAVESIIKANNYDKRKLVYTVKDWKKRVVKS
jgi:hypothetical protein